MHFGDDTQRNTTSFEGFCEKFEGFAGFPYSPIDGGWIESLQMSIWMRYNKVVPNLR